MLMSSEHGMRGEHGRLPAHHTISSEESIMGIKDTIQDKTGIYKLGFDPASILGILLPVLFVVLVGGALAFLVLTQ